MSRVIEISPEQARRAFWRDVQAAGIDCDYFERLLHEDGPDEAVEWLKQHNFWDVRASFGNAWFLTSGDILGVGE